MQNTPITANIVRTAIENANDTINNVDYGAEAYARDIAAHNGNDLDALIEAHSYADMRGRMARTDWVAILEAVASESDYAMIAEQLSEHIANNPAEDVETY